MLLVNGGHGVVIVDGSVMDDAYRSRPFFLSYRSHLSPLRFQSPTFQLLPIATISPPPLAPTANALPKPHSRERHRLLDLRNRLPWVQALRARPRAVEDRVAPVQTHAVVQHRLTLRFVLVARVGEPAVGLEEDGGAEVFFAVPPVRGAGCRAAGAEDAFVESVELFAVRRGLSVLETLGRGRGLALGA